MEQLFVLGEKLVSQLKKILSNYKEDVNYLIFEKAEITNTNLVLTLSNDSSRIVYKLSVHPLDRPWEIRSDVSVRGHSMEQIEVWANKIDNVNICRYEIYPNLLSDVKNLGKELSVKLASDLVRYYSVNISKNG